MKDQLLIAFSFIALLLLAIILHKVRRSHMMNYRMQASLEAATKEIARLREIRTELDHLYNQFQAYQSLVSLLQPRKPLPLLRRWAASPDFLLEICQFSLRLKPALILECSSGASTLVLARSCELNGLGHVYSLEHDAGYAEQTRQRLKDQNLERWATVIDAPLVAQPEVGGQRWYSLEKLEIDLKSVELLVIDGPPSDTASQARYPAVPLLMKYLSDTCTVYLDDANRPDERAAVDRWLHEFGNLDALYLHYEKGCARLTRKLDA